MFDADKQAEQERRYTEMAGPRMCAACKASASAMDRYDGDQRHVHWTFEPPDD